MLYSSRGIYYSFFPYGYLHSSCLLSPSPYILVCFLLFLMLKKKVARVIFFLPWPSPRYPLHGNVSSFLSSSSSSFGEAPNIYVEKELQAFNIQTSRALSLIGPPPPSQALWRSVMLAPSRSGERLWDVRWLSGQLGSWLSLSSDGSQRSDCVHVVVWTHFHIWLSLAALRPRLDYFQRSTMCASVTLDPLG